MAAPGRRKKEEISYPKINVEEKIKKKLSFIRLGEIIKIKSIVDDWSVKLIKLPCFCSDDRF